MKYKFPKADNKTEFAAVMRFYAFVSIVVALWVAFNIYIIYVIQNADSIPEGFTIYSTALSGLGTLASIVAIYVSRENRSFAVKIVILSFIVYTSSSLAKFYYVDVNIPFILNECEDEINRKVPICSLLNINSVLKYGIWFNISTFFLSILIALTLYHVRFQRFKKRSFKTAKGLINGDDIFKKFSTNIIKYHKTEIENKSSKIFKIISTILTILLVGNNLRKRKR